MASDDGNNSLATNNTQKLITIGNYTKSGPDATSFNASGSRNDTTILLGTQVMEPGLSAQQTSTANDSTTQDKPTLTPELPITDQSAKYDPSSSIAQTPARTVNTEKQTPKTDSKSSESQTQNASGVARYKQKAYTAVHDAEDAIRLFSRCCDKLVHDLEYEVSGPGPDRVLSIMHAKYKKDLVVVQEVYRFSENKGQKLFGELILTWEKAEDEVRSIRDPDFHPTTVHPTSDDDQASTPDLNAEGFVEAFADHFDDYLDDMDCEDLYDLFL